MAKTQNTTETLAWERQLTSLWPTVVDDDTIFYCLEHYQHGSVWEPPLICCVCGLEHRDMMEIDIQSDGGLPFDFSPLHDTDPFIMNHQQFKYGMDVIDEFMLEPRGFKEQTGKCDILQICGECHPALEKNKVPCLALANGSYRGKLPDQFNDLTQIEEMVCAKYRNIVHITCIYPHHSVLISDSNVDNNVTLYRLRHASGRPADVT